MLETLKMTKFIHQYLATITVFLFIISCGMHYAWPSPSLPILLFGTDSFRITSDEGSWIAVTQLIGASIGCILNSVVIDVIGRKYLILSTAIPLFASWIIIAFAQSALMLFVARFIAGLGDGVAFTAIPLYVGEIADPKIRGLLGSGISVAWILGMLLINVMGSALTISETALVSAVVPFLAFVTFAGMPESPYYLILEGKYHEALKNLEKFKGSTDVDAELQRLKQAVRNQTENSGKFLDLFVKRGNRRGLLIMMFLRNGQQMSGTAAFTFYTQIIFKEAGDFLSPEIATLIFVVMQLVMAGSCSVIVDKTGRRVLLFISAIGSIICLFIQGTYFYLKACTTVDTDSFNFVPIIALVGFVILFNVGLQPIPLVMLGELFPTNVKAFASSFSEIYFCVLASSSSKLFQILNDSYGMYLSFYIFAVCSVINLGFIVYFVPETKGKTLEEIQENLENDNLKIGASSRRFPANDHL